MVPDELNGSDRTEIAELSARLFGLDGEGGAIGSIRGDVARVNRRLDRWDGAITLLRAGGAFLGIGGVAIFLRALIA